MKIYVASSWRNQVQPTVVEALRAAGHEVYDFRNPAPGNNGFHWSEIDPEWKGWDAKSFRDQLAHPIAEAGFETDMLALEDAECTVLVMPCGRSAHLELGYAVGAGQSTIILLADGEPELMYKMAGRLCTSIEEVVEWVGLLEAEMGDCGEPLDVEPVRFGMSAESLAILEASPDGP